jgi:hypothetical protein
MLNDNNAKTSFISFKPSHLPEITSTGNTTNTMEMTNIEKYIIADAFFCIIVDLSMYADNINNSSLLTISPPYLQH